MIMTDQEGNATKYSVYWIQISKEINVSAYTTCGFRNMEQCKICSCFKLLM